jgi:hypothetical protein
MLFKPLFSGHPGSESIPTSLVAKNLVPVGLELPTTALADLHGNGSCGCVLALF